jgi:F1F0 ATPase subunit 2
MTGDLLVSFVGGALLGAAYLRVLWLLVRRLHRTTRPAAWLLGSAPLRLGLALAGFAVIAAGSWPRLVAALGGFLAARLGLTAWLRARLGGAAGRP